MLRDIKDIILDRIVHNEPIGDIVSNYESYAKTKRKEEWEYMFNKSY